MAFSAIVSLLDEQAQEKVESYWDHLEKNCGLTGIRITPYPHLSWQVAENHALDSLQAALSRRASLSKPVVIQTSGLGIFSGPSPVVYLLVVKTLPLMDFHQVVWDETARYAHNLSPNYHPDAWIPHITLAYRDITPATLGCVMQEYAFQKFDWKIRLDNLALVTQEGSQVGVIRERYDFPGAYET